MLHGKLSAEQERQCTSVKDLGLVSGDVISLDKKNRGRPRTFCGGEKRPAQELRGTPIVSTKKQKPCSGKSGKSNQKGKRRKEVCSSQSPLLLEITWKKFFIVD